jgi:hypothetical protein
MIKKAIQEEFESYCKYTNLPPNHPGYDNIRKAFFAGAITILSTALAMGESDLPEELCVAILQDLQEEAHAFATEVIQQARERN